MGSVGIAQVPSRVDLMWLQLVEKVPEYGHIVFPGTLVAAIVEG